MKPVQLRQGINLVQTAVIEIKMKAREEVVAALVIDAEVVAERAEGLEGPIASAAKALPQAQVRFQRQRAGVLQHLAAAGGDIEVETRRGQRTCPFAPPERVFGPDDQLGKTGVGLEVAAGIVRFDPDFAELRHDD